VHSYQRKNGKPLKGGRQDVAECTQNTEGTMHHYANEEKRDNVPFPTALHAHYDIRYIVWERLKKLE
jgi:hypothetical protein